MIRLQAFGELKLTGADGAEVRAVLRQPKRLALLAYLAIAGRGGVLKRDSILLVFWPDKSQKEARHALSQALTFLRKSLGAEIITARAADEVGINPEALSCDVVDFDVALAEGRHADALAVYGEVLPGFYVADAGEWDVWLDGQRQRLRSAATAAAWKLAEEDEARRNPAGAAHWARLGVALEPADEAGVQRLMRMLEAAGDRAGAVRVYGEFERRMREEFELEPAGDTSAIVTDMRARRVAVSVDGRAVAVRSTENHPLEAAEEVVVHAASGIVREPRRRVRAAVLAVIVLVASAAGTVATLRPGARPSADAQPIDRIAIMPFEDESRDSDLGYFANGIATTLGERLAAVDRLTVIPSSTTRQFSDSRLSHDSLGALLNVGATVGGSVTHSGGVVRVTVELKDARTGAAFGVATLERPDTDLLALLDTMATAVAFMLRAELGREVQLRDLRRDTDSELAWTLLARGRAELDEARSSTNASSLARIHAALDLLKDAALADPRSARVHAERSDAFVSLALATLSDRAAANAFIDSAHASAGRAVALDSASEHARERRGNTHFLRWTFARVPLDEMSDALAHAEADLLAALELNPNNARALARLSQVYFERGDFAQAYDAAQRAYRADAYVRRIEEILWRLFEVAFELELDDEAGHWCDELRRRVPKGWLQYTCTLQLLGWSTDGQADPRKAVLAYEQAQRTLASLPAGPDDLELLLAGTYARAGEADSARAILSRSPAASSGRALVVRAAVHMSLGERDQAIALLREHLRTAPSRRDRLIRSRFFTPLGNDVLNSL